MGRTQLTMHTLLAEKRNLPSASGVSLKPQHYEIILETLPDIGWFEVHPENYMGEGGLPHYYLDKIRQHYPLSMHGVGMSLGSSIGLDQDHLEGLKKVVDRFQPTQVSEHLAWSHWHSIFLNDLLPIPYTNEFLTSVSDNIDLVQNTLKRTILIENPSIYLSFNHEDYNETDFLHALVKKTGCRLLLDINNVYVTSANQNKQPSLYLDEYPLKYVEEIHLAGHSVNELTSDSERKDQENVQSTLLIDDHGSAPIDAVWTLFESTFKKIAKLANDNNTQQQAISAGVPTLLEWDTNIPDWATLFNEAKKAEEIMGINPRVSSGGDA